MGDNEFQRVYDSWKSIALYPCGGGVFGPMAHEYGLTATEAVLLGWIHQLAEEGEVSSMTISDKEYVWMDYKYFLQQFPILNVSSTSHLSTIIRGLVKRGLLEKHNYHSSVISHRVYFHIPEEVEYFLFCQIGAVLDFENICRAWVAHQSGVVTN